MSVCFNKSLMGGEQNDGEQKEKKTAYFTHYSRF